MGRAFSRQSAMEQCHADRQRDGALRRNRHGRGRSHRPKAQGARRGNRSRSRLARGVGCDGGSGRCRRRHRRRRTAPHHRRQQLHARGQLLLQRGTLHPARAGEDGDVSQGIARVSRGHATPASRDRARRGSLREHEPARLFRAGQRHRPPPDRRVVRRDGQRQGNERDLRGSRFRQARDQHARHRRAGSGRGVASAQHPQPLRLRSARHRGIRLCRIPERCGSGACRGHGLQLRRLSRAAHCGVREALRRRRRVRRHALEHP